MLENGTVLVPTLCLFHSIVADGAELDIPPALVELARQKLDEHVASFRRALDAGVSIAVGSDIGSPACPHGTSARELGLLVEFGMTPMQALVAATAESARMLRRDHEIGTIESGKLADLVVVNGDPLADIRVLQDEARIEIVLKGGEPCVDRRTGADLARS